MSSSKFSLKFRFVLIVLVIGITAVFLIFRNNELYRDLVYSNEEKALNEKVRLKSEDLVEHLNEKHRHFSANMLQNAAIREGLIKGNADLVRNLLNNQFFQFFTTSGQLKLAKLAVLDKQFALFSMSDEGLDTSQSTATLCLNVINKVRNANATDQYKIHNGLCIYNGMSLSASIIPIGGINLTGYLMVVTDLAYALQPIEHALNMPMQFRRQNGDIVYQSTFWPSVKQVKNFIHSEYNLSELGVGVVLNIAAMRDMTELKAGLSHTTQLSFLWLALIVIPALLLTVHMAQRALSPLKQLKYAAEMLGKDKFTPLSRTHYPEIDIAIDSFNDMAQRISGLIYRLENEINQRQRFQDELHTHRRKLEIARDQAMSASKTKSDFLANMSHEIRTPLTAIIGFAESSLDPDQTMEERLDAIKIIIKSGRHLLQIINDILDLSKIEAGKLDVELRSFSLLNLTGEIESLMKLQAEDKQLEFRMQYEFPLPMDIHSDALRIKQVLLNLCSNAIKFTEKGYVHINVRCDIENGKIYFEVIDTGIGLTEEQINKIFDAFTQADTSTTRKYGGTGLGLSLSRQLTQKLGGTISVNSTFGIGSRFTASFSTGDLSGCEWVRAEVELPQANNETQDAIVNSKLAGRILLAEDNANNQRLLSLYFKRMGTQVVVDIVGNGKEAIDAALRNSYDVIFMDMQMPIMGGLEAVARLRAAGYTHPIVALTANTMKEDELKCRQAGCNGFISKPVNRNLLYEITSGYLSHAATDNEPIYSSLEEDDYELFDVAQRYVADLPDAMQNVKSLYRQEDYINLKSVIHQLKGSGAAFGFEKISDLAAKIEFQIINNNPPHLTTLIAELENICLRAQAPQRHEPKVVLAKKQ